MIAYLFRLAAAWAQKNPGVLPSTPPGIAVDALVDIPACGLGQGRDAQHASFLVSAGPLVMGFQMQTAKLAHVLEQLHQTTRGGFADNPSKPPKH